jgi:alkylation response protein AidB-like acyl-CoA dehydrogenase
MTTPSKLNDEVALADLETALGNPYDASNPLNYEQILAADECGELSKAGEGLLDRWKLNAEFVPRQLGGRLEGVDLLINRLRPLFRRDVSLGLGYGVTSLMASVNVWAAGSTEQRQHLARLLLENGKVAIAYHELKHGNDFLRNEFSVRPTAGGSFILNGTKQVINNARRATALILFARTDQALGGRSHSILLVDKRQLSATELGRISYLGRYRTAGVRGCQLDGLSFRHTTVAADSLVGQLGEGVEIALRSFQITRIALPGMALGMWDTALHTVLRFITGRRLYGTTVNTLPHARNALATSFVDFLIADSLVRTAARAVHLSPGYSSIHAAAVKYLVPLLLEENLHTLSIVLGARFYLRTGEHAIFGKLLRDVPVISLGHAGSTACLLTIVPQLRLLAKRGSRRSSIPTALFNDVAMPALDFSHLSMSISGGDALMDTLLEVSEQVLQEEVNSVPLILKKILSDLSQEAEKLSQSGRELAISEAGVTASATTFLLAEHYIYLAAAGACLGVWRQHRATGNFLGEPSWIIAALLRLRERFHQQVIPMQTSLDQEIREEIFSEIMRRFERNLSFCLQSLPLSGGQHHAYHN